MRKIPTDLELLNTIYENYYDTFVSFSEDNKSRSSEYFVPIDIELIAKQMNVNADVVFGMLYYHLNNKYGYSNDDGKSKVMLFTPVAGDDKNCVHFPYLSSILADMRREDNKYKRAIIFSAISATVSIISLTIALITFFNR